MYHTAVSCSTESKKNNDEYFSAWTTISLWAFYYGGTFKHTATHRKWCAGKCISHPVPSVRSYIQSMVCTCTLVWHHGLRLDGGDSAKCSLIQMELSSVSSKHSKAAIQYHFPARSSETFSYQDFIHTAQRLPSDNFLCNDIPLRLYHKNILLSSLCYSLCYTLITCANKDVGLMITSLFPMNYSTSLFCGHSIIKCMHIYHNTFLSFTFLTTHWFDHKKQSSRWK